MPSLRPSAVTIVSVSGTEASGAPWNTGAEAPASQALRSASVPVSTSVPVPEPLTATPAPLVALSVPLDTASSVRSRSVPASGSLIDRPVSAVGVSSAIVSVAGVWLTGTSFTAATLIVSVFGVASMLLPPSAVPPSSCTWNVKLATPAPWASAGGVQVSRPSATSLATTKSPALTRLPFQRSVPCPGNVVIVTRSKVWPSASL